MYIYIYIYIYILCGLIKKSLSDKKRYLISYTCEHILTQ